MNVLLVFFLIQNQDQLVDPTIETCRKIRYEIYLLDEEIKYASEKRKKELVFKLNQLKKKLSCNEGD